MSKLLFYMSILKNILLKVRPHFSGPMPNGLQLNAKPNKARSMYFDWQSDLSVSCRVFPSHWSVQGNLCQLLSLGWQCPLQCLTAECIVCQETTLSLMSCRSRPCFVIQRWCRDIGCACEKCNVCSEESWGHWYLTPLPFWLHSLSFRNSHFLSLNHTLFGLRQQNDVLFVEYGT